MTLVGYQPEQPVTQQGPNFNLRHPDWSVMALRWRMAWSFYRGGVHVLDPDHTVYTARVPLVSRTTTPVGEVASELASPVSDSQWTATVSRSYLWKHDRETAEEFTDRSRRLYHLPLFRSDINNYCAGILKQSPARRDVSAEWKAWHANTDGRGTDIDALMRRTLARGLVFGRMHAVIDRRPVQTLPKSRAEEKQLPPPYAYLVSPLDLVDWCIGEDGQWDWVVLRRDAPDKRKFGEKKKDAGDWYTVIDREAFYTYRQLDTQSDSFERVSLAAHDLGLVPMATLWATEEDQDRLMSCESPFADALDLNRHVFNKLSELDETERLQTFSILGWPTSEGAPLGELNIGQTRACTYDSQAGTPSYISPDYNLADGKWRRIEAQIQMSRTLEGTSRGRAEYSKEERSAASMTVENEDKRNRMSWWANSVQEFDLELHRFVAKYLGHDVPKETAYVKDFEFRATSTQIADIGQLKSAGLPKKAIFVLAKGPVERILRENGVPPETIDGVLADIDAEAVKPEPAPMGGVLQEPNAVSA